MSVDTARHSPTKAGRGINFPSAARTRLLAGGFLVLGISSLWGQEPEEEKTDPPQPGPLPRLLMEHSSRAIAEIGWRYGETLQGELTGADGSHVTWKTDLFSEPVRLRWEVIRRVDFGGPFVTTADPFRIVFTDGSHLTGALQRADEETMTFTSAARVAFTVRREQLVSVERIRGEGILTAGPASLLTGESVSKGRYEKSSAYLAAAGQAVVLAFNGGVKQSLELPERTRVEVRLRTQDDPQFSLRAAAGNESVSVETWGDEIVLVHGDRFASIGPGSATAEPWLHLRLLWDRNTRRCALYGADGQIRAELPPAPPEENVETSEPNAKEPPEAVGEIVFFEAGNLIEAAAAGAPSEATAGEEVSGTTITLLNKGAGLIVDRYAVSEWLDEAPAALDSAQAQVETADEIINGELISSDGLTAMVRRPEGEDREIPLDRVRGLYWPRSARLERDPSDAELWFQDGNLLRGRLLGIEEGKARLETSFATEPVSAALDQPRALVLPEPGEDAEAVPALNDLDVIAVGDLKLHGMIRPTGKKLPDFQPVGSDGSLAPVESANLTITRSLPKDGVFQRAPALLHVKGQETWPVSLVGIGRDAIEYSWDAAEKRQIGVDSVHAIQLSAPDVGNGDFSSPGWRVLARESRAVSRSGNSISLPAATGIGHSYLLQSGDFSFRLAGESGMTSIRVRLFCQGTARDSDSMNFLIAHYGSQVYCGQEREESGQMQSQTNMSVANQPILVRFSLRGDQVLMFINDVQAAAASLEDRGGRKMGAGLILETAAVWGNRVGPALLSDFSVHSSASVAGPPPYSEDAKREALLLPRLRREAPPRQVLVAQNGDLLRGEIAGMAAGQLLFRTGLEQFKIAMDRLAAVVWVEEPDKIMEDNIKRRVPDEAEAEPALAEEPAAPGETAAAEGLQWLDLTNGGRLRLAVDSWTSEHVEGMHSLLGRCRIPTDQVHTLALQAPDPGGGWGALANWKFENTIDPLPPGSEEANASPLLGQAAADFTVPMLEGPDFVLSKAKGKVVVLDFWATWCAPCARSLPPLIEALAAFPEERLVFIAVNQGESKEQVQRFLDARRLQAPVGFDAEMGVGRQFAVEGIPHTVVIDPAGSVVYVSTGAIPDGAAKVAEAVGKALGVAGPEKEAPEDAEGSAAAESKGEPENGEEPG